MHTSAILPSLPQSINPNFLSKINPNKFVSLKSKKNLYPYNPKKSI